VEFPLYTNTSLAADLSLAAAADSAGIGLFRSELPFMLYDRFPSEQEQNALYRKALEAVAPRPVNLRTLDAGGDKPLPYLRIVEANPALGSRGIRFTLDHPDIFLTQLRAALRADIGLGNLRLLLPMISDLDDLEQALSVLNRAKQQLGEGGYAINQPDVGIMIEVPSVIYQLEQLARQVDYLSVGTNDLAQYLLATDRNNPQVSRRLDHCHPALLHALQHIAQIARRAGKMVTVCGEMANEPGCALLLLGMGFDGLSIRDTACQVGHPQCACRAHAGIGRARTSARTAGTCSPLVGSGIAGYAYGTATGPVKLLGRTRRGFFPSTIPD
jgi:phosphotransferase system enzyme I (PtsP)